MPLLHRQRDCAALDEHHQGVLQGCPGLPERPVLLALNRPHSIERSPRGEGNRSDFTAGRMVTSRKPAATTRVRSSSTSPRENGVCIAFPASELTCRASASAREANPGLY